MSLFRSLGENDNFISLRISELKKTSHYKINTSIMLVSLQNPHVLFTFIHVNMNGKDRIDCTANCSQLFPLPSVRVTFSVFSGKFLRWNVVFSSDYTTAFINILCDENIFVWKLRPETCPVSSQSKSTVWRCTLHCCCCIVVLGDSISSTGAEGMHFLLRRKERMNCEIKLSLLLFLSDLFHK